LKEMPKPKKQISDEGNCSGGRHHQLEGQLNDHHDHGFADHDFVSWGEEGDAASSCQSFQATYQSSLEANMKRGSAVSIDLEDRMHASRKCLMDSPLNHQVKWCLLHEESMNRMKTRVLSRAGKSLWISSTIQWLSDKPFHLISSTVCGGTFEFS
jgi:hypothetical protein